MIKNGRPYTTACGYGELWVDDGLITDLPENVQRAVYEWIETYLEPRARTDYTHTSYGLKHILQHKTGIYLTNNEFKDAMMQCGYMPSNPNEVNWNFQCHIDKKSANKMLEQMEPDCEFADCANTEHEWRLEERKCR